MNKTILKPRLALAPHRPYVYVGFFQRKIPAHLAFSLGKAVKFCSLYDIGESNPVPASGLWWDRAQKFISSSMSRHLSTCNVSSKSMHSFSSNLTDRQTNEHGQKHVPPPLSEVTSDTRDSKPRPTAHCRVLPPGEFNGSIPILLPIYLETFIMTDTTVFA